MSKDYTAIRVSKAAREAAENAKRDGETWDEYIRRCTENPPEVKEFVEATATSQTVDLEAIVDRIEETQGVTIENVEVDAGSTLTREGVEAIVENWVERNYDRLRRGEI